jgi:DNA-binding Xre family transcriptional regulator
MIEIRVDELLAGQGRSFYWLAKQTGISHTTLWRLKKGKSFGINLDTLEKMCRALEWPTWRHPHVEWEEASQEQSQTAKGRY